MSDDEDERPDFDLVMPFIVCASNGGPFEDQAFVAGYECGLLDAELEFSADVKITRTMRSDNLAQVDLIALKNGYTIETTESHDGGWATVEFTAVDPSEVAYGQPPDWCVENIDDDMRVEAGDVRAVGEGRYYFEDGYYVKLPQ